MIKFHKSKEKYIKHSKPIKGLKNNSHSPITIGTAIMFNEDGEYKVSVKDGTIVIEDYYYTGR